MENKRSKRLGHIFLGIFVVIALFSPAVSLAEFDGTGGDRSKPPALVNPIKYDDLGDLIFAVAREVAKIGFYVVVIFIIYSGFLFVTAAGNKAKLDKAKETFLYTVIGAAILLGATVLANVIKGTVDQLKASSAGDITETRFL